ncbi:hypothetical protein ACH3XW_37020 [Acanthocheilonema viteae]
MQLSKYRLPTYRNNSFIFDNYQIPMKNMKNILVLLLALLAVASVESFAWGYPYYGEQSEQDFGQSAAFNPGGAIAGAVLGKKK